MTRALTRPPNAVAASLQAQTAEERRRAIATLLAHPLIQSSGRDGDLFRLVRRHGEYLKEWFARHCGWSLLVEADLARLRKVPADTTDTTRPLLDSGGRPFTRRRYLMLCLALAALEKSERQTVLCKLADEIQARFQAEPRFSELGFGFDVAIRDHRRDLIEVIRFLIRQNVLAKVDGDEQQYLTAGRDVLYNINPSALAALPGFRRGPSTVSAAELPARLESLVHEPFPDTDDGRNRRIRTRLFRRLVDDPVMYYAELPEEERTYFVSQRPSIVREIEAATGLVAEARKEGIAMVDPHDELVDIGVPEEGTDGHIALLVAEQLATRLRSHAAPTVAATDLEAYVESLIPEHRTHWRKNVGEPGTIRQLVGEAIRRLVMLRLARLEPCGTHVTGLAAIARFAVGKPRVRETDAPQLWGES